MTPRIAKATTQSRQTADFSTVIERGRTSSFSQSLSRHMNLLYSFATRAGRFFIGQSDDGRFHAIFRDQSLGSYLHAWQAADDLAAGATFSIPGVDDSSLLGISDDLKDWDALG